MAAVAVTTFEGRARRVAELGGAVDQRLTLRVPGKRRAADDERSAFGSKPGVEAITVTAPVRGSSATTAPL